MLKKELTQFWCNGWHGGKVCSPSAWPCGQLKPTTRLQSSWFTKCTGVCFKVAESGVLFSIQVTFANSYQLLRMKLIVFVPKHRRRFIFWLSVRSLFTRIWLPGRWHFVIRQHTGNLELPLLEATESRPSAQQPGTCAKALTFLHVSFIMTRRSKIPGILAQLHNCPNCSPR